MIKTETQIERDFYSFVKNSDLGKAIRGTVYRSEMRPTDARDGGFDRQIPRRT